MQILQLMQVGRSSTTAKAHRLRFQYFKNWGAGFGIFMGRRFKSLEP
jgi:hypothetical protein